MAPNKSAISKIVDSNTWKIHDRRMSEWTIVVEMYREPLPMACPRKN